MLVVDIMPTDGRQQIVEEIDTSRTDMRKYLIEALRSLLKKDEFNDALPGYLPPDSASQARLPILRKRLKEIAGLSDEIKIWRHSRGQPTSIVASVLISVLHPGRY